MALVESAGTPWTGSAMSYAGINTSTSASYTPSANVLLVCIVPIGNSLAATGTSITLSGTGFFSGKTWTQLKQLLPGTNGGGAVFCLDSGPSPSAGTITATVAGGPVAIALIVREFAGAAPQASQSGVTNSANGTLQSISLTPGTTGSQVVGLMGTNDGVDTFTWTCTNFGTAQDTLNGSTFNALENTGLSTSGTPVSLGFTQAAKAGTGFVAVEIVPGSSGPVIPVPQLPPFMFPPLSKRFGPNPPFEVPPQPVVPPPPVTPTSTPAPVVVNKPNASQWFNTNIPIVSFAPQPPPVVSTSTPAPVVVNDPNASQWYNTNPVQISFAPPPPPVPAQPVVETAPPASIWFESNTPQVSRSSLQDTPTSTPDPVVVAPPNASQWYESNPTQVIVPPAQPVVAPATSTPSPVVVTSQPASTWFNANTTDTVRNTLQDPVAATATPDPIVVTSQPAAAFFRSGAQVIQAPQSPPVAATATPDPIVVTSQPPTTWLESNPTTIIRNPAPTVIPALASPDPVVVQSLDTRLFQVIRQPLIIRNPIAPDVVRVPLQLAGTITETNVLGGTVTNLGLGGTVVGNRLGGSYVGNVLGGTVTETNLLAGSVVDGNILSGTVTVLPSNAGSLVEWTMQEVDINLGEFNDETLAVTVTSGGSALNLTGQTLQALFKTAAGVLDTDPSTITLTSPSGGIVVTNAPGGLATITIPRADLVSAGITFWRLDVVSAGGLHNTAIYGKVAITLL